MTYVHLTVGVVALLLITAGVTGWAGLGLGWSQARAVARAAVQLALLSLALRGVLTHGALVGVALVVMFAAASWTAARRLRGLDGAGLAVVVSGGVAAVVSLSVAFVTGMLDFDSRYVLALGGIVIGSTMTANTLAGRNYRNAAIAYRDQIEAWLSIGSTPSQSVAEIGRDAARDALVPVTDQTRTTGLVTLPGAFVGALMGGASPLAAGRFQLVVLVCLIAAQAIAAVLLVRQVGHSRTLPTAPI